MKLLISSSVTHYRQVLASAVERNEPLFQVSAVDNEGIDAPATVETAPDVVLAVLHVSSDLNLVHRARRVFPETPIVAISFATVEGDVLDCVRVGVEGFVTRDQSFQELLATLYSAWRGERAWSTAATGRLLSCLEERGDKWCGTPPRPAPPPEPRKIAVTRPDIVPGPDYAAPPDREGPGDDAAPRSDAIGEEFNLTSRQQEVLLHVADGLSNKEIARKLAIELPTVKHHVHQILRKMGVTRRTAAIALFHRPSGSSEQVRHG